MNQQIEISGGEVRVWIEQEAVHLIAITAHNDPVELTRSEAIKLAKALMDLSEKLDS